MHKRKAKTVGGRKVDAYYRRTGMFTCEKHFLSDKYTDVLIEWDENELGFPGGEYEYSSYEK